MDCEGVQGMRTYGNEGIEKMSASYVSFFNIIIEKNRKKCRVEH